MTSLSNNIAAGEHLSELLAKGSEIKDSVGQELSQVDLQSQLDNIQELKKSLKGRLDEEQRAGQLANLEDLQRALESGSATLDARVESAREGLETVMTESTIVPIFAKVTDALPGDALGFIPADFKTAMDILNEKTD